MRKLSFVIASEAKQSIAPPRMKRGLHHGRRFSAPSSQFKPIGGNTLAIEPYWLDTICRQPRYRLTPTGPDQSRENSFSQDHCLVGSHARRLDWRPTNSCSRSTPKAGPSWVCKTLVLPSLVRRVTAVRSLLEPGATVSIRTSPSRSTRAIAMLPADIGPQKRNCNVIPLTKGVGDHNSDLWHVVLVLSGLDCDCHQGLSRHRLDGTLDALPPKPDSCNVRDSPIPVRPEFPTFASRVACPVRRFLAVTRFPTIDADSMTD